MTANFILLELFYKFIHMYTHMYLLKCLHLLAFNVASNLVKIQLNNQVPTHLQIFKI